MRFIYNQCIYFNKLLRIIINLTYKKVNAPQIVSYSTNKHKHY